MAEKYTYRAGDIDVWVRQDGTAIPYYDVEDELNRLAAENAALRELYGAAWEECLDALCSEGPHPHPFMPSRKAHAALRIKHADVLGGA